MRTRIAQSDQRTRIAAFSMVELLVATAVVGVMFVALYAGFSSGFAVIQLARENLRATQILQEKMETIRLYTWDQLLQTNFVPKTFVEPFYAAATNTTASGSIVNSGLLYTGSVTIARAPLTESYSNEIRMVTIGVNWRSAGVLRKREMSTLVTRNGLQNYIY